MIRVHFGLRLCSTASTSIYKPPKMLLELHTNRARSGRRLLLGAARVIAGVVGKARRRRHPVRNLWIRVLSRMIILEEGLRCRLYLKEVTGRGPGPHRRDGAVMNSTAHQGGRAATDDNNLKPGNSFPLAGLYGRQNTISSFLTSLPS